MAQAQVLTRSSLLVTALLLASVSPAAGAPPLLGEPSYTCASASDYYDQAGLHSEVELGPAVFTEPIGENGAANPLNILDCDSDGTLELFITVSPEESPRSPARPAEMRFRRTCADGAPTLVSFVFTQGGLTASWRAYDSGGVLVDVASSSVSGTKQAVVLSHPKGIARVVIAGIRLCIERVCWDCTRTESTDEGCVDPADFFSEPGVASVVHLGPVIITEATFPHGAPAPLTLQDCGLNGSFEVFIRWSENPLAPVRFLFPAGCGKTDSFPEAVAITFTQGSGPAAWNAYDPANHLVDSAATAPSGAEQSVVLSHPNGIRRVEVLGSSICIEEICWRCGIAPRSPRFHRGDADTDGELSLNDAIRTLNFLFLGTVKLACDDAADSDDNGEVTMTDALRTLNFLFLGGPQPPGADACAADATQDELGCDDYRPCGL